MKNISCSFCKNPVTNDEVALNVKLIGKQLGSIRCYKCMADFLNLPEVKLIELASYYKNSGCLAFTTNYM